MQNSPFRRAMVIADAISAALVLQAHLQGAAMAMIPEYKSRGKGKGHLPSPRFGKSRSKYQPHEGAKQATRAARQRNVVVNGFEIMQTAPRGL